MSRPSRFQGIFDAAHASETEPAEPEHPVPARFSEKRLGRPPVGKKSNPTYRQVTAYVRRDLYRDVRIALLRDPNQPDFSDLIDELLERWHRGRVQGDDQS